MSKKKIIITIAIIISLTIGLITTLYIVNLNNSGNSSSPENLSNQNWAINDVSKPLNTSKLDEDAYKKSINNVIYQKLNNLNYEQLAVKNKLFSLVSNTVLTEEAMHGDLISVDILDSSNDQLVYIMATFLDNQTQKYVLVYDDYNTHNFLNCQTIDKWSYYHSDENKG